MTPSFERQDGPDDPQASFQVLFARNPLPTWVCDQGTLRVLAVNDAAITQYGYSRDEFLAMTIADLGPPEEARRRDDGRSGDTSPDQPTGRHRHRRKSSGVIDVELTSHVTTFRGRPAVLVIAQDVSGGQRRDRQVTQLQKMDAIGRLAGTVAHDFNNILTTITGYCDLVLDDPDVPDVIRSDVDEIKRAASSASNLTKQLLAFSRRRAGEPEVLDINDELARLRGKLQALVGPAVQVVMRLAPAVRPVRLDDAHLEQVVLTLATNARDAMTDGGRLTIETANVALDDGARAHGGITSPECVRLTVRDTGIGMNADVLAHLFEPFFTTKPAGGGRGLGLATTYAIVRQNHGQVLVESEPGQGATVTIDFPALADARTPDGGLRRAEPPEAAAVSGGGETILVVEDDDRLRLLAEKSLKRFGYTVLLSGSAAEALEIASARQGRIDLLMTDVMLPGMNGAELAQQFASRYPSAKVLFCSGYAADAIAEHGAVSAEAHLLQKPYTPIALAEKVRQVLDGQKDGVHR